MEWIDFQRELVDWLQSKDGTDEELIVIINKCPHRTGRKQLMSTTLKHINIKRRKDKIKQIQDKLIKRV